MEGPSTTQARSVMQGSRQPSYLRYEPRRRVYRWILRNVLFPPFVRIKSVRGLENLPRSGPAIVLINHIAFIDPVAVLAVMPRNVVPMAKVEVYDIPVFGLMTKVWGVIPVRRGEVDREALRSALSVLREQGVVLLAPEGTRSPALIRAREGVAYLAHRSQAPLVPVAVEKTEGFPAPWPSKAWRRGGAEIEVGRPFRFRDLGRTPSREELRQMTDEAMYILAAMLPPERRGVYADLSQARQDTLDFA